MTYIIPSPCNVQFQIKDLYTIPSGCNVLFYIGDSQVAEFGFVLSNVVFNLTPDKKRIFAGEMVLPKKVTIILNSGERQIVPLWPINIQSVQINTNVREFSVEVLPDMKIKSVEFNSSITDMFMRATLPHHLPTRGSSGLQVSGWGNGQRVDDHKLFPWDTPTEIKIKNDIRQVVHETKDKHNSSSWFDLNQINNTVFVPSLQMETFDFTYLSSYTSFTSYDKTVHIPWGALLSKSDKHFLAGHDNPAPKDSSKLKSYDEPTSHDVTSNYIWNAPGAKDVHNATPWGPFSYFTLCNEDYQAPPGCQVKFGFPNKYELVPNICSGIAFHINNYMTADPRCTYLHNHSGERDINIWVDPENKNLTYPVDLGVYHMLNTVLVEEVITGRPIEVLHVDAKIDMSSWLWSFSVTVASKCFLDIIKPQGGVLGNIKINMNGYIFFCTVEGWSENRSWGSEAWTITGRSPSMCFGEPMSDPKTKVINTGMHGATIFDNYMLGRMYPLGWPFQTWIVDFGAYEPSISVPTPTSSGFRPTTNWYLPENTVSYSDKTDIDFLKELAESIGAYIQTSPTTSDGTKTGTSKFMVKPRYAHQPWNWNAANLFIPWKTINEGQCLEIGRSSDTRTEYQAVNVLGESVRANSADSGTDNLVLYTNVVRDGYDAGTIEGSSGKYAPMVTDPYITHQKAAAERGRMILGSGGEWVKHTLRIGIVCSGSGLFYVGDMISVLERGTPWFGQVTGVTIGAVSAGFGFGIEQVLEVEEYRGN